MTVSLNILLIEDNEEDALLLESFLRKELSPLHLQRVETTQDLIVALELKIWHCVISDFLLPSFNGFDALHIVKQHSPNLPFIVVSGAVGEENVVSILKAGAQDYIAKGNYSRVVPAVNREIAEAEIREQHIKALDNLKRSEQKLKELNASKDKFFSIISHDLRNPLSAIVGYADLLFEDYEEFNDEKRKKFIAAIRESSHNTLKLLQNILDWARLQAGSIDIKPEVFDLSLLIAEVFLILNSQANSKKIGLVSTIPSNIKVLADRTMIKIVVVNLITNAIKFSNSNSNVEISCEQNHVNLTIRVADTGVGIDSNNIYKLFNIEQKYTTLGTQREKGSGLGLIICKEFIEKNNGNIWVDSKLGEGSVFSFTLPI